MQQGCVPLNVNKDILHSKKERCKRKPHQHAMPHVTLQARDDWIFDI